MDYSATFWTICALGLSILLWGAWSAYASWVESRKVRLRLDAISADQRGLRRQLSNVLSMLLRAGFKRGRPSDWSDDALKTRVMEKTDDSSWWKR